LANEGDHLAWVSDDDKAARIGNTTKSKKKNTKEKAKQGAARENRNFPQLNAKGKTGGRTEGDMWGQGRKGHAIFFFVFWAHKKLPAKHRNQAFIQKLNKASTKSPLPWKKTEPGLRPPASQTLQQPSKLKSTARTSCRGRLYQ